jgi:hypothetical protein
MKTEPYRLDKAAFSLRAFDEPDATWEYWCARTPEERLEHMEFLRQLNYDYDPIADRLPRVVELLEYPPR